MNKLHSQFKSDGHGGLKDIYESNRNYTNWIEPRRVAAFKTLFKFVCGHVGGRNAALKFIGTSNKTITGMNNKKLSEGEAKKIMDAYQKVKALEVSK